jgi:hypothetical protein
MGDRGNIFIKYDEYNGIYFYTHWRGSEIRNVVKAALSKRERWDDDSYLARIIFDELTGLDGGSTGYGISPYLQDYNHPTVIVDIDNQCVYSCNPGDEYDVNIHNAIDIQTFEELVNL